jgi:hypothetical protein
MPEDIHITTNNVPRFTVDARELTSAERKRFDYLDWDAIECGKESATFIRYKGETYDLDEFMTTTSGWPEFSPLRKWDRYLPDTYFSGILIRYSVDCESVVVATYLA